MRAIWSFWSKPYGSHYSANWLTEKHHWLSWVLSVETARRHYPDTALITDDEGADILVDRLGIQFSEVSLDLEALSDEDPCWWALGKLYAYRAQQKPFVHIDADVFLWKRLPLFVEQAPVFAQSPESADSSFYQKKSVIDALHNFGGWIPEPWQWYATSGVSQLAANCGIVGGTNTQMINEYAKLSFRTITDHANRAIWKHLNEGSDIMVIIEQYLLNACVEYSRRNGDASVYLQYLFGSIDGPYQAGNAAALGYSHLISGAKKNRNTMERIERVVRRDYPALYRRCMAYTEEAR
ncbi:MAG: hypothetical protein HKP58_10090 [Desulfatitalea sp.]|nr:hypothetical protein [Desulfatitalea sp.]NNK00751.1 hypothetical protein [Desulfatitalea sp.]